MLLTPALWSLLLFGLAAVWALGAVVQQMMELPADDPARRLGLVWLANILAYGRRLDGDLRHRLPDGLAARRRRHHAADAQSSVGQRVPRRGGDGAGQLRGGSHEQPRRVGGFRVAWVATIPLWLIPGFSLLIPCC